MLVECLGSQECRRWKGKKDILAALEHALDEDATVEDAIDYLLHLHGIEEGLEDERTGRLVSHDEIVEMIRSWAK